MKRKHLVFFAILLCFGMFVFSGYKVVSIIKEYREGEMTYDSIQQYVELYPTTPLTEASGTISAIEESTQADETEPAPEVSVSFPTVDFDSLLEISDDVVAWVYIEDTKINYPVVQGEDNSRYLSVMIDGTWNAAGSIFMDYRNAPDFTDPHTILYGHHMQNGTMFAGIRKYRDQEYYEAHPDILIMTPDKNYQFQIFAGYVAEVTDPAWQLEFESDETLQAWIDEAISRSGFTSSVIPEPGDTFLTLSTCSYEFDNARFVLVAVLKN